jgi:hypothetical protein
MQPFGDILLLLWLLYLMQLWVALAGDVGTSRCQTNPPLQH